VTPDVYVDSVNPTGLHQCIVEGDGRTVWMYLHDLQTRQVIADSPLCSLVQPMTLAQFKKTHKRGDAPPLVEEYSTGQALVPDLTSASIILRWGKDGISVVAFLEGEPFSMIVAGEKNGYSRALSKEGPWGHPWDEEVFGDRFAESRCRDHAV